ncbi:MAG: hypothetical protein HRT87_10770 [Legionellales bacterium]|nr:hypothetical protein [Legionellales bacterium]
MAKTNKRKIQEEFGLLPWEIKRRKIEHSSFVVENQYNPEKLLARQLSDQRTIGQIEQENLHKQVRDDEYMDIYKFSHPVAPNETVALGQKAKGPRQDVTVAMQLRTMMKSIGIKCEIEKELNSIHDYELDFLTSLERVNTRKKSVRLLSDLEGQALLRSSRLRLEIRGVEKALMNSLANAILNLIRQQKAPVVLHGMLAILSMTRDITDNINSAENQLLFKHKEWEEVKRWNAFHEVMNKYPVRKKCDNTKQNVYQFLKTPNSEYSNRWRKRIMTQRKTTNALRQNRTGGTSNTSRPASSTSNNSSSNRTNSNYNHTNNTNSISTGGTGRSNGN